MELFVENHNAKVEEKKRFTVGNVTVMDSNDYIHYSNSEHSVTLEAIKGKLIKTYGGFLFSIGSTTEKSLITYQILRPIRYRLWSSERTY